jgi:hypothetical protein
VAALCFGWPALRRAPRTPALHAFRVLALAFMAAALAIRLPGPNTADKMPFVFYILPAVAAGWGWASWVSRGRPRLRLAISLAALLPVNLLYVAWYAFSPADPPPDIEAMRLRAWLRENAPPSAVVLDSGDRDEVVVWVPRRQYWGRESYARQWGYDPREMDERRRVRDVLLSRPRAAAFEVERAVIALDAFARNLEAPVFVIWRPADHGGAGDAESVLFRRPDRFRLVWYGDDAAVYRFLPITREAGAS